MRSSAECASYYLVIDGQPDQPIFVFLDNDPGPGFDRQEVTLEFLPIAQQLGWNGAIPVGRPVLGFRHSGVSHFRQFRSLAELLQAGWSPLAHYRICDSWEDYYSPWSGEAAEATAGHQITRSASST